MIAIRIGTEYLKLPAGFSLQWDLLHPAFSENLLGGGYTFPIEFERCPENDLLLNFSHKLDFDPFKEWEYKVYIEKNGSFWREAKLYIDRPGTKKIGGYLRIGLEIFDNLEKKLEEVDYGGDILIDPDPLNVAPIVQSLYDTSHDWTAGVCFPMVYNPDFYGDKNLDFKGYLNNFDFTINNFLLNAANAPAPSNINCLVPMPYAMFIISKIFEQEGYTLYNDTSLFSSRGWDKEYIYSNYPLDALGDPHYKVRASSPSTSWAYGNGQSTFKCNNDSTGLNYDPDNRWDTGVSVYTVALAGTHEIKFLFDFITGAVVNNTGNQLNLQIDIMLDTVSLQQYGPMAYTQGSTHFGLQGTIQPVIETADIGKPIWIRIWLWNPVGLTVALTQMPVSFIKIDALENNQVNIFKTTMNIKNHVPDKTIREFLEDIKTEWQIGFHLDEGKKEIRIIPNTDTLIQPVNNITNKTNPDHESTPNTEKIKLIGYNWPSDDDLVNDNFKEYEHGSDLGSYNGIANFPTSNLVPGQTARDENTNRRYIAVNPVGSTSVVWIFLRDDYDDLILDNKAENEFRLNNCPLFMYYDAVKDKYFPQISQPGSSESFGMGVTRPAQRFAWAGGSMYPWVGSTTQAKFLGSASGFSGSRFFMNGATPAELLYYHYTWLLLLNGKFIVEKTVNFNINDIEQLFLYMGSKGIIDPVHIDTMDFIIKKVSISESDKIDEVKLELLRLP